MFSYSGGRRGELWMPIRDWQRVKSLTGDFELLPEASELPYWEIRRFAALNPLLSAPRARVVSNPRTTSEHRQHSVVR